ncbi:FUSC family protein, partial [Solirubrobacter ginsenosidimutans]
MTNDVHWARTDARHAALSVLPAVVIILAVDVKAGVLGAIGLLPVCLVGIAPQRPQRIAVGIVGLLFAAGVIVGSVLIQVHVLAVIGIFVLCFLSASLMAKKAAGLIVTAIVMPAVAIGMSYDSISDGLGLALFFALGSIWATLTSLLWPTDSGAASDSAPLLSRAEARRYGILLGLAAATAVSIALIFDFSSRGWTAAATLLVMRPVADMVRLRGVGRALATISGVVVATFVLRLGLSPPAVAALVAIVFIATIATRTSRWYLASAGTAVLILLAILYGTTDTDALHDTSWTRVVENVIGAAIALFYGLLIPS